MLLSKFSFNVGKHMTDSFGKESEWIPEKWFEPTSTLPQPEIHIFVYLVGEEEHDLFRLGSG